MLLTLVRTDKSSKDVEYLNGLKNQLDIYYLILSDQIIKSIANLTINEISVKYTNDFLLFFLIKYLRDLIR